MLIFFVVSGAFGLSNTSKTILNSEFRSTRLKISTSPALTCPVFTKANSTNENCIQVTSNVVYSECPNNEFCDWNITNPQNSTCTLSTIQKTEQCPVYNVEDSSCDKQKSQNCVKSLYCDTQENYTNGTCKERVIRECSQLDQCIESFVCNNNDCIKQFSLKAGQKAATLYACESAILLNGTCQNVSKTVGDLPKQCQTNSDCISSSKTAGVCKCIGNHGSYCSLHQSDELSLKFLSAVLEDREGEAKWLNERINKYPLYEFETEEYLKSSLEYRNYQELENIYKTCSGLMIAMTLWVLLVNS